MDPLFNVSVMSKKHYLNKHILHIFLLSRISPSIHTSLHLFFQSFHYNTNLRLRCSPWRRLSGVVTTERGVRQQYILVPLLCNLYFNPIIQNHPLFSYISKLSDPSCFIRRQHCYPVQFPRW